MISGVHQIPCLLILHFLALNIQITFSKQRSDQAVWFQGLKTLPPGAGTSLLGPGWSCRPSQPSSALQGSFGRKGWPPQP